MLTAMGQRAEIFVETNIFRLYFTSTMKNK